MQISIILIKAFPPRDTSSLDHIKSTTVIVAMIKMFQISVITIANRLITIADHHPVVQVDPVVRGVHPGGTDLHHHRVDEERQSPRILAGNDS